VILDSRHFFTDGIFVAFNAESLILLWSCFKKSKGHFIEFNLLFRLVMFKERLLNIFQIFSIYEENLIFS